MSIIDASVLQYLEDDDWRVLTAVEMGQRNHELVATELIQSISGIHGSIHKFLDDLVRNHLLNHEGAPYDGYELSKTGYDFLALHTLVKRGVVNTLGSVLGRGKEADVFVGYDAEDHPLVLKFHRIGRVSFRKAKDTREYLSNKHTRSWLYLSRLSAQREFSNLLALQNFPVPRAIDSNRHCTVMSLIPGTLLNNIQTLSDPPKVFDEIVGLAVDLLKAGVVHGDFSEFNIMIGEDEKITLIDFPQCIPYTNREAEEKFNHDLNELRRFFTIRFHMDVESIPQFKDFIDQIVPIDLNERRKAPTSEEEEDSEEEDKQPDKEIQARVSKENRFRRKPKRKNNAKALVGARLEAKAFE